MEKKGLKLKSSRTVDVPKKDYVNQASKQSGLDRLVRRSRRGEGTKSSPLTTRRDFETPTLSLHSRSEGNLVAAQMFDLKSKRELVEVHNHDNERTLQLPKLHRDTSSKTGLTADKPFEVKQKNGQSTQVKNISSIIAIESRTFAIRESDRKRQFKQHIEQEENEYQANESKRDSLLRWLSEQNTS